MQNQNDAPKPTDAEQPSGKGLDETPCCASLADIQSRFPNTRGIKYAPDPKCKCKGSGISPARVLSTGTKMREGACECCFLGEDTKLAMGLLRGATKAALGSRHNAGGMARELAAQKPESTTDLNG